jgi:L-ascorbate metabolism protein UlaG (beta-lactamase superfamily)
VSKLRPHPSVLRKLRQLWGVVRESHRTPLQGKPNPPKLVDPEQLGITFIGHSSFLVQIAGRNLLIDPVFATRLILLRRQRHPGILIDHLPPIDAVLLTHAHMDHLNLPSLRRIIRHAKKLTGVAPQAIVPAGVRDLVENLGFRSVTELEWWQSTTLDTDAEDLPVEVTMTPARHWGARMFKDTHRHFGGYVIAGAGHSVYHSGDTAYFNGFHEIGRRLQPQIALLPIGAYFPDSYRAVHTSPEEGLQAFLDLETATTMIPMHYGTFPLGREPMSEPPIRLMAAAKQAGITDRVDVLGEGETFVVKQQHGATAGSTRLRSA